ncbi:Ribosomal silencing factor during starvation [Brevinema andersonii]|uniref:Ribosomal silencing factor during starvation n=1 Tax=Brevinema andersonii TaxID=34097 RepID=A0A1I1DFY9_BREAD|nr:ribosome silencing factor [Brevinema andersonii]SFB71680.1 Ribosomal silencing factor during starvation [Brevinema andersonii]
MTQELQVLSEQLKKECERLTMTDIIIYDVKGISPLTDVVVIATADHFLQLEAARRSLSQIAKQAGFKLQNPTEDYSEGWLAMDFSDLVVHILVPEKRDFYDLDSLMSNIKQIRNIPDFSSEDLNDGSPAPLTHKQLRKLKDSLDIFNEDEL